MKYFLLPILFTELILLSCRGKKDDDRTFYVKYIIGTIPAINDFLKLNEREIEVGSGLDSLSGEYDKQFDSSSAGDNKAKLMKTTKFRNNRARIFMDTYINGQLKPGDSIFYYGAPAICACGISNDTLIVRMAIGFFGGTAFTIKLHNNNFQSTIYNYTDDASLLKTDPADTAFHNEAIIYNKYQYLILDNGPTFKNEQQITGYLTYTSNTYYEKAYKNKLDSIYLKGKIYFTCNTALPK
jgi:hypothetical protein